MVHHIVRIVQTCMCLVGIEGQRVCSANLYVFGGNSRKRFDMYHKEETHNFILKKSNHHYCLPKSVDDTINKIPDLIFLLF
jgi:hypothetical protein